MCQQFDSRFEFEPAVKTDSGAESRCARDLATNMEQIKSKGKSSGRSSRLPR